MDNANNSPDETQSVPPSAPGLVLAPAAHDPGPNQLLRQDARNGLVPRGGVVATLRPVLPGAVR